MRYNLGRLLWVNVPSGDRTHDIPLIRRMLYQLSYRNIFNCSALFKHISISRVMYSEAHRPTFLDDVIGHTEAKDLLQKYLESKTFEKSILLTGSPGIGKTTLALAAARSFGFDPLEINASKAIRSFEDVEKIKDACRSAINIHSFLRGDTTTRTCVVLDEIDGSDPHAQQKIIQWIKDKDRKVPIIFTSNEVPTIFKRNTELIEIIRCFPPRPGDLEHLFPDEDVAELIKECNYDIRRMFHRVQYGKSDVIPKYQFPPTGLTIEKTFVLKQRAFGLPDPLGYHDDTQDTVHLQQTKKEGKNDGKRVRNGEASHRLKKSSPDK